MADQASGATATASVTDFEPETKSGNVAAVSDFEPEEAKAAPAAPPFEDAMTAHALASVKRPALPRELRPTPPSPPTDWQRLIVGGLTSLATDPELGGETGIPSLGEPAAQSVKELETPGQRGKGALRAASTGVQALAPVMGPGAVETGAAIEAAPTLGQAALTAATPVAGIGAGAGASAVAGPIAKHFGADPDEQEMIKELAFWAPTVAGMVLNPKLGVATGEEGTRVGGTVLGGRAGAGVQVTPEAVTVGGKFGPFSRSKTFPRGGGPGQIEPPTIDAEPGPGQGLARPTQPPIPPASDDPMAQAATAINAKNEDELSAARTVQGVPQPAPPPPPPGPPPIHEVTPEMASKLAEIIQKLPPQLKAKAIIEMHGEMADQLLRQGKVVGPSGKLEVIDSPKTASRVAQQFINDEVERQDKMAEEAAKNEPKIPAAPKANPNENPVAQAKALPKSEPVAHISDFTKEPTNESTSQSPSVQRTQPETPQSNKAGGAGAGESGNQTTATESGTAARKTGREAFTKGARVQLEDGRKATVIYTSPEDPFVRVQIDGGGKISKGITKLTKLEEPAGENGKPTTGTAGPAKAQGGGANDNSGGTVPATAAKPASGSGTVDRGSAKNVSDVSIPAEVPETKFKFGNTQAPIAETSEAHRALESARARISPEDLAGKGADVGGNHVTVRYGIKGDDHAGIKKYLSEQPPFEASLGKTEKFPPSDHSDGAAVIKAPVEAPDLHRMNAELEKHGEFTEPSFKDYKPHATVAYVKPEKADRYVGMSITHGKKFTVTHVAVTDRNGNEDHVKLEGKPKTIADVAQPKRDTETLKQVQTDHPDWTLSQQLQEAAKRVKEPQSVRLYRGENAEPGKGVPDYVKGDEKYKKTLEASGRWFSSDKAEAQKYADDAGNGRLTYIDVPAGEAEKYEAHKHPEASKFIHTTKRSGKSDEYFVPRELADTAKPHEGEKRDVAVPASARGSQPGELTRPGAPESKPEATGSEAMANAVYEKLSDGESLGNVTELNKLAEQHFGSSRTSGEWTPKDAFDAMEAGVNKYLLDRGPALMALPPKAGLAMLRELMPRLTTQGTRTEEQVANQQFSTPPTESYIAARVAALKPTDVVLEPSAGNGGLAVWPKAIGAEVHVNEIAPRRQEMLKLAGFGKPTAYDGEIINAHLDPKIKPTVVLMNPPFSASTQKSFAAKNNNQFGFNHVNSALQRLEEGGRLVAILGGGQANEPNGGASLTGGSSGKWFDQVGEKYNVRANIRVHGKEYAKYGTAFATRLIVIDKDGPTPSRVAVGKVKTWDSVKQANVNTLEEAYDALKEVAESRPEVTNEPRKTEPDKGQSGTGVEPGGVNGPAGERPAVRRSGETAAGDELPGRPDGSVGSAGGDQTGAGNRGTAVREPRVQPGEHPEAEAPVGPKSGADDVDHERPLSGTETSDAALSLGRDKNLPVKEEEDSSAYVPYHPTLKGPAHPANIVETRTMATVPLPEITYKPSLPESVVNDSKLSAVQLEAISIAGQQNDIVLPDGSRATALIGDGTGVGKGRIGAGILWDNWRKGRKRLVWVSEKWDLMQDAIRDLQGIGAHDLAKTIKPFGKISAATPIDHEGVLFTTYALIRSEDKKGNSRVSQMQQWLKGKDEASGGYILYDESHNLKNAVAANAQQVSQIGKAVKKMMLETPNLRSVSLSATAATDVINLGYLDRLGLWGPGTPFPNGFGEFQAQIASGGMSAMEMVARELKAQGKYLSRTLSYKGVTYSEVEHELTADQKELYRTATKAWASVVQQAEDTIKNTTNGGNQAKARFMSLFYGAQLRFFNVLLTTLKIPTAVERAKDGLANDKSVVITLVNTNEAAQNREKNRDRGGEDSDELPDYDFGPGEMLKDLVREHYPVQQFVDDVDSEGNPIKVPAYTTDKDGRQIPLINPQAVKERDKLVADLDRDLKMPANPLDILINSLGGPKKVAELTGRKERYDESTGKFVPRGDPNVKRDEINLSEMRAFQGGKKRVAILSSAAGTGISLHAGNDAVNQQKRRHLTLQPGWSADKAMQMMGRTHRSNEAQPPEYETIVSDLGGEKRFSSTLAKRMGSLGALSKGQSNANAGADLMEKVNFESDQGRQATTAFYNAMLRNIDIPGTKLKGMQVLHDLRVLKKSAGGGGDTVPPADRTNVTRLLNRLLALDPDVQNSVYNYFYDVFQATVQAALEDGTLDTGVKTLPGDDFEVKEEKAISKDPKTGAETFYYPVDAQVRTNRVPATKLAKLLKNNQERNAKVMRNKDGKVSLVMEASPIVHASGTVTPASYVVSPENGNPRKVANHTLSGLQSMDEWAKASKDKAETEVDRATSHAEYILQRADSDPWMKTRVADANTLLDRATKNLEEVSKAADNPAAFARDQWEKQYEAAPTHITKEHHLIGGAVLRWWNPIRDASEGLNIYTAVDSKSGKRVVGVDIPPDAIKELLGRITGSQSTVDSSQLQTDVLRNNLNYSLEGGTEVRRGRVNRQPVVQFIPPNQGVAENLKRLGLVYERGVQPVYYLPNAKGVQEKARVQGILDKILKQYPVISNLVKGEEGSLNVGKLGEAGKNFLEQDVQPILKKAGVGIKEVAAMGVRALYPRIEHSNPVGRALGIAAPSDAVDALMKVQGDRAKNLAEFTQIMKGIEKSFDRMPEEDRIDFIDRIQTGEEQPTPDLAETAEMFKKIMDGQRDAEEEAINLDRPKHITATAKSPIELSRKENYFHNWWETPPGKEPEDEDDRTRSLFLPKRPLEGTKGYNKRQSYTLKSGIEAGGEPATTNPVRILLHRIEDGMKFVTARRAWYELGQLDLRPYVRPGQKNPPGFVTIDDRISKVYFPAELESGATAMVPGGHYAVEANTARLLNNMLSRDKIRANALGRGLMWLKNASTAIELGISPFHAVFESIEAMSSMMALGMQRAYNQGVRQGKAGELLQGMKEIISSPMAPISLAREGAAIPAYIEARARLGKIGLTEFGHIISGDQPHGVLESIKQFRELRKDKAIQRLLKRYPDLDQFVDDMFQGGLVVGQHRDYQVKMLGKTMTEALTAGNPLGAVWRSIPTVAQGIMSPLFNIYIPSLKYSLFLRMMSEQVSEHSRELENGTMTRATLARKVADSVENRFGELNFDNLFLNRSVKTAMQFIFRSAAYKLGTAREMAGAAGGQGREMATWAKDVYGLLGGAGGGGGKGAGVDGFGNEEPEEDDEPTEKTVGEKALPRLDMRASWIAALMIMSTILGAVVAKLLSKKHPWEWVKEDRAEGMSARQALYLEFMHPRTGETDSHGKPVRVSLPTYIKEIEHASTEPVRYVVGSLSSMLSRAIDVGENKDFFGNFVYNPHAGIGTKAKQIGEYVAPTPFVYSSYQRSEQQGQHTAAWLSAFGFPKSPSDLDFTPAEKLARELAHHEPETPEEMEEWREKRNALQDGTASQHDMKKYLKTQRYTWLQRQVHGMSYKDALDVMDKASPSEQMELHKIMDTKRHNALKAGKTAEVEEFEAEHEK